MAKMPRVPDGWRKLSEIADGPIPNGRLHSRLNDPEWQRYFRLFVWAAHRDQHELLESLLSECAGGEERDAVHSLAIVSLHRLRMFLVNSDANAEMAWITDQARDTPQWYAAVGPPEVKRAYSAACRMFATGAKTYVSLTWIKAVLEGENIVKAVKDAEELVGLVFKRTAPKASEPKPISKNEDRDKFIYERRKEGLENKLIRKAVNETPGWPKLGTDQAVNGVVDRYCKRHQLNKPRYKTSDIKRH